MKIISGKLRLAATDVSNHLACHHLTNLQLSVARGDRDKPEWRAPDLAVIQELGERHEADYLAFLQRDDLSFVNLTDVKDEERAVAETLACMEKGIEVIAQGSLASGRWFGRTDVLRKVPTPSKFGNWSYEVYDCKLARETKATTILQLAFYSELLETIQGVKPEFMYVVPPWRNFEAEKYRVAEYAAYYRYVKEKLEEASGNGAKLKTYPEPCTHCDVCRWFSECNKKRREDDHLSLVAGINRLQRKQLEDWKFETVAKLAEMPLPPPKPLHGSREGIEKVQKQARLQVEARNKKKLLHEFLDVETGMGFCRLPEPSPGDVFVDLEGDAFVGECGHQYLFGIATVDDSGALTYDKRWAFTAEEEKRGFEWVVEEVMKRWKKFPAMHVYHFGAYEPSTFKRLMGTYATKEEEIDSMLRAGIFVDLHTVFKQAIRASVEEYGLKQLEGFYAFARKTPPEESKAAMRYVEHQLELGWDNQELRPEFRDAMERYNGEDCFSTAAMRDWLEGQRAEKLKTGVEIPRPPLGDGAPSEEVDERQKRIAALAKKLMEGLPEEAAMRSPDQQAKWLLAALLDWHRREDKAVWWDYYRLRDMKDDDLLEERPALSGLKHEGHLGMNKKSPVERYSFPKQETDVRKRDKVCSGELSIGTVEAIDIGNRTIDIKRSGASAAMHPTSIFVDGRGPKWEVLAESIFELGEWASKNAIDASGPYRAARDLLLRNTPRLEKGESVAAGIGETPVDTATRIVFALEDSVFAIQGPPGAGKTHTAASMICHLVTAGRKVGVTALSHKVIWHVLNKVSEVAADLEIEQPRCVKKAKEGAEEVPTDTIKIAKSNDAALKDLQSGYAQVTAGTSWMWARPEFAESVDVLFIDEAGQMALADVIAAARAAKKLVLIGDPQQLQRPLKGSHPDGAEKSALEHLIGDRKTIAEGMGMLLPQTWRLHPKVCAFTSELFYDDRLGTRALTHPRVVEGHAWLNGAGLWRVPVDHDGNRNSSPEEVEVVAKIVESLLKPGVRWFRNTTESKQLTREDILIVAPYNAQVSDLSERLPGMKIGTVDKFQGQEAPVVIFSLTTSSPEDAPRGMEFLYSLNRFNVATSRAMTAVIVVGSPRLFEPECRSPRQMQLANAFCAYLERAKIEVMK